MKEQKKEKKRSRVIQVGSEKFNETIIKLEELTTKYKGMQIAKPSGKLLGGIASAIAKPFVSIYDGFKEGYNGKEEKKEVKWTDKGSAQERTPY